MKKNWKIILIIIIGVFLLFEGTRYYHWLHLSPCVRDGLQFSDTSEEKLIEQCEN